MAILSQIMIKNPHQIKSDALIQEAAKQLTDRRIGSLLVEKNGQVIGILTETDIVRKAVAKGLDLKKEKVELILSKPVITVEVSRSPEDAHDLMAENRVRHLVVTDAGKIVGIVSVRDLLVFFKRQSEPHIGVD
jgi:CBS domain-containing protein